ncbi:hypothetical protein MUP32_04015 [Candidatus Microgenomates bacterium]|nr:hypothetical protein [Candidatus Microgenomates bacterium]
MKPSATIYVSNMSEDVWPFISAMSSSYKREMEIQENLRLSEHDLFSFAGKNNCLMILPSYPSNDYLKYVKNFFQNPNFKITATKIHTGEISKDILYDKEVLEDIDHFIKGCAKVNLVSYCISRQFLTLGAFLKAKYPNIYFSESPDEADSWTVDFYGSKSGIRQLSQQSEADEPDFKMAEGLISFGTENTAKIAAKMYTTNGGVVIKTNKGHSGAGLLIFRPGDLSRNCSDCEKTILKKLNEEKYWVLFPIVLEKYIEPKFSIGGGYPNVEFKIHKNGKVEFLYYCACRLTREGVFKGIEIHNDVLSDHVSAQIVDTGFFVGEKLAREGYRGYFDVDFIAAKNGNLYVAESNTRRTGGTHVYYLAQALFGKDFMYETYTLSNNIYKINTKRRFDSAQLFSLLNPVLFDKKKQEGLVITGTSLLAQNSFGYVIFGKNKQRALKIEMEMEKLTGLSG